MVWCDVNVCLTIPWENMKGKLKDEEMKRNSLTHDWSLSSKHLSLCYVTNREFSYVLYHTQVQLRLYSECTILNILSCMLLIIRHAIANLSLSQGILFLFLHLLSCVCDQNHWESGIFVLTFSQGKWEESESILTPRDATLWEEEEEEDEKKIN